MSIDKVKPQDVADYAMLGVLVLFMVAYAFGFIDAARTETIKEWVSYLLIAYGFKKVPQAIGK